MKPSLNLADDALYRIEVQGNLDAGWADWLNGAVIQVDHRVDGIANTNLIVKVPDQSALRGLLGRLWNLNLTLVSLQKLEQNPSASIPENTSVQETRGGA